MSEIKEKIIITCDRDATTLLRIYRYCCVVPFLILVHVHTFRMASVVSLCLCVTRALKSVCARAESMSDTSLFTHRHVQYRHHAVAPLALLLPRPQHKEEKQERQYHPPNSIQECAEREAPMELLCRY